LPPVGLDLIEHLANPVSAHPRTIVRTANAPRRTYRASAHRAESSEQWLTVQVRSSSTAWLFLYRVDGFVELLSAEVRAQGVQNHARARIELHASAQRDQARLSGVPGVP
jgi:hypothetical protein